MERKTTEPRPSPRRDVSTSELLAYLLVEGDGFELIERLTDLQSAPFGHWEL